MGVEHGVAQQLSVLLSEERLQNAVNGDGYFVRNKFLAGIEYALNVADRHEPSHHWRRSHSRYNVFTPTHASWHIFRKACPH